MQEYDNGEYEVSHGGRIHIVDNNGLAHMLHFIKCDVLNVNRKYQDAHEDFFRHTLSVKTPYDDIGLLYYCHSFSLDLGDDILHIIWAVDKNKDVVREVYYNTLELKEVEEHPMTKDKKLIATIWGKVPKLFEGNLYEPNSKEPIGFH
jgi:hypothetical protein